MFKVANVQSLSQESRRIKDSEMRDQWDKGQGAEGREPRVPKPKRQRKPKA